MSMQRHLCVRHWLFRLATMMASAKDAVGTWLRGTRHDRIALELLISGRRRRRTVRRQILIGLRKLERVFPSRAVADVAVIVQQVVVAERQLAGCCQISQCSDGSRFALIRLALQVDGRSLTTDELLAVLAEQYIALAMQSVGTSLLVPIDLDPPAVGSPRRPTGLRPDPLAPRADRSA